MGIGITIILLALYSIIQVEEFGLKNIIKTIDCTEKVGRLWLNILKMEAFITKSTIKMELTLPFYRKEPFDRFKRYGDFHREGGPAIIKYFEESICSKTYYIDGRLHREDGPAVVDYDEDGRLLSESYFVNGKHHRDGAPAYIEYYKGKPISESYYIKGALHREDGPAYILYDVDEESHYLEEYYIAGIKIK